MSRRALLLEGFIGRERTLYPPPRFALALPHCRVPSTVARPTPPDPHTRTRTDLPTPLPLLHPLPHHSTLLLPLIHRYFKDPNNLDLYLECNVFLADVNNEHRKKSAAYADNLAALEKLVLYRFDEDSTGEGRRGRRRLGEGGGERGGEGRGVRP